jgi:hypothetical protein
VQIWWCRGAEVLRFNINRGDCAGDCAAAKEQVQTSRCADVQRCRCGAGVKCCAARWCSGAGAEVVGQVAGAVVVQSRRRCR